MRDVLQNRSGSFNQKSGALDEYSKISANIDNEVSWTYCYIWCKSLEGDSIEVLRWFYTFYDALINLLALTVGWW